jgi:hypothetical protein
VDVGGSNPSMPTTAMGNHNQEHPKKDLPSETKNLSPLSNVFYLPIEKSAKNIEPINLSKNADIKPFPKRRKLGGFSIREVLENYGSAIYPNDL